MYKQDFIMDYDRQQWLDALYEKDSRLFCDYYRNNRTLCKQSAHPTIALCPQDSRTSVLPDQQPKERRKEITLKGIRRQSTPKLTMAELKNRAKFGSSRQEVISSKQDLKTARNLTQRCATEQLQSDFSEKFYWKSIPEKLQIRHKVVVQNMKKQTIGNPNFLKPQKNNLIQTKVSTNGFQSIEFSKEIERDPQNPMRPQTQIPCIQPPFLTKSSQTRLPQPLDSESARQSQATRRSIKMREHDIEEVESISRSRLTELSGEQSRKDFVLEESFVEWTYETGFKTELGMDRKS